MEVADAGFRPLDAAYIPDMMGGFVQWINAQLADPQHNPLRLAAASHVLFETIHPYGEITRAKTRKALVSAHSRPERLYATAKRCVIR